MYSEMVPGRYWYCNPQTLCVSAVQGKDAATSGRWRAAASDRSAQAPQQTCGGASRLSPVSHSHQTAPMRGMAAAAAATHSRRSLVAGLSSLPLLLTSALAISPPLARSFTHTRPRHGRSAGRLLCLPQAAGPCSACCIWPKVRHLVLWSIFGTRVTEPRWYPGAMHAFLTVVWASKLD
jgi:hypothetical protein